MTTLRPRKLVIKDSSQWPIHGLSIDLTGVANANNQYPLVITVQEQCDLGHWHDQSQYTTAPWGSE